MRGVASLHRLVASCLVAGSVSLLMAGPAVAEESPGASPSTQAGTPGVAVGGRGPGTSEAPPETANDAVAGQPCPVYGNVPGLALDASGNPFIANVKLFLDTCPQRDPNLGRILSDFYIFRDGVRVTSFPCIEPVSAMPVAQYTDELIYVQVLRAMYYMDRGQSGHLPWTSGTLYNWMKSQVRGINIVTGVVGGYCCVTLDGRVCFVGGTHDDANREFDKKWAGISNVMAFAAHERRHLDGSFIHSSCCGIAGGCDDTFDVQFLAPYGVQWWLEKCWLEGEINVGVGCLSQDLIWQDSQFHLGNANRQYRERFCTNPPPLLTAPASPGGPCPPRQCPCPTIALSPSVLPTAKVGAAYSQTIVASGGTSPYTFAVTGGSLPSGLSLSSSGVLAGTPAATGVFSFTVAATDAAGCTSSRSYTLPTQQWHTLRRHLRRR